MSSGRTLNRALFEMVLCAVSARYRYTESIGICVESLVTRGTNKDGKKCMRGIVAVINSKNCRPVIDSKMRSITLEEWLRSARALAVGRVHLGIVNTEPQPI